MPGFRESMRPGLFGGQTIVTILAPVDEPMQITLEGHDQPVPVEAGDTILASLLRAGVAFPFSCQAGNCGTCKCELVSGDILELEYSEHALAAEGRAKGIILACRTQVWDATVVRRIDSEDLVMHPSRVMRCRVLQLEALTHDIRGVHLAIEAAGLPTFSASSLGHTLLAPPPFRASLAGPNTATAVLRFPA